jgi:hypothetical protein
MDPPSAKRRKTASPTRSSYASYMSPTKASLARYNPTLLTPRRARSTQASPIRKEATGDNRRKTVDSDSLQLNGKRKEKVAQEEVTAHGEFEESEGGAENDRWEDNEHQVDSDAHRESMRRDKANPAMVVEDDDDLPETPQKLRDAPEFQDTPPRGIFSSTPRRRKLHRSASENGQQRNSDDVIDQATNAADDNLNTGVAAESQAQTAEVDLPTREMLHMLENKTSELKQVQEEIQRLRKDVGIFEEQLKLNGTGTELQVNDDISAIMYVGSACLCILANIF